MVIAVPGIALACAAIFAVIVLWATATFAQAIAGLIPKDIPIIGKLHDIILAIGAVAVFALQWIMADIIGPAFAFISKPVLAIVQFIASVQALGRTIATSWLWLLNSALPSIIAKLERYAHDLVTAVRAYVVRLYHAATKYAHTLVLAARAYALTLYRDAIKYAHSLVSAARVYAHDLFRAEEAARVAAVAAVTVTAHDLYKAAHGEIGALGKTLENEIKAITSVSLPDVAHAIAVGVQQAEDYATTAVAAGIGVITTDVVTPVAAEISGLIDDVGKLAGVIGTDLPDIRALVDSIPLSVPLSIAGVTGLSLALSRVSIKYMERCGIPNCRNLGGLGHLLEDLLGAASLAGLLAMLTEMIHDPEGAAGFAADELSSLVSDAQHLATDLLGV